MTLVFADDFSTDPNTSGLWTIHRYANDPSTEAAWDAGSQLWHLTLPRRTYRAVAVFANSELTATEWKAAFRYRAGKLGGVNGGGDGFIDEGVLFTLELPDPDYTFSGVGFGAGTGGGSGSPDRRLPAVGAGWGALTRPSC